MVEQSATTFPGLLLCGEVSCKAMWQRKYRPARIAFHYVASEVVVGLERCAPTAHQFGRIVRGPDARLAANLVVVHKFLVYHGEVFAGLPVVLSTIGVLYPGIRGGGQILGLLQTHDCLRRQRHGRPEIRPGTAFPSPPFVKHLHGGIQSVSGLVVVVARGASADHQTRRNA